jgi:hypothetical protein
VAFDLGAVAERLKNSISLDYRLISIDNHLNPEIIHSHIIDVIQETCVSHYLSNKNEDEYDEITQI